MLIQSFNLYIINFLFIFSFKKNTLQFENYNNIISQKGLLKVTHIFIILGNYVGLTLFLTSFETQSTIKYHVTLHYVRCVFR